MQIKFLGHSAFELKNGDATVLIDPFIDDNPVSPFKAEELEPTTILLSHGHQDHLGDTKTIAKRTGAPVVSLTEIAHEMGKEGIKAFDPNLGGTVEFDWGSVKLVQAWHTSMTPNGTASLAAGFIINFDGVIIYHLGDTALFGDLELIGKRHSPDVALIPIGGHFTMDREDGAYAAKLIQSEYVIPCHYNTFPLLATDVELFKADVEEETESQVIILEPGEHFTPPNAV